MNNEYEHSRNLRTEQSDHSVYVAFAWHRTMNWGGGGDFNLESREVRNAMS